MTDPNTLPVDVPRSLTFKRHHPRYRPMEQAVLRQFKAALLPRLGEVIPPDVTATLRTRLRQEFWAAVREVVEALDTVELDAVVEECVERERNELQSAKQAYVALRQQVVDLHADYVRWRDADTVARRLDGVERAFRATLTDHNPYVRKNAAYGMGLAMAAALGMTGTPPAPLATPTTAEVMQP